MIEFDGVNAGYRRGRPVLIDLDLLVDHFPCVLLGPNGAGKSTLLRLLSGALRPASGSVALDGARTDSSSGRRSLRRQTGWLTQDVPVLAGMNVLEQVAYAGWLKGMTSSAARRRALPLLERLNLADRAKQSARTLSGGQRRRMGIAQAMIHEPHLLLLDEPYAGLDPEQRASVRATLQELATDTSLIVSTHQTEDVEEVYRSVLVLEAGVIKYQGDISDFLSRAHGSVPSAMRAEVAYRDLTGRS